MRPSIQIPSFEQFADPLRYAREQAIKSRGYGYGYEADLAFERVLEKRYVRYRSQYAQAMFGMRFGMKIEKSQKIIGQLSKNE